MRCFNFGFLLPTFTQTNALPVGYSGSGRAKIRYHYRTWLIEEGGAGSSSAFFLVMVPAAESLSWWVWSVREEEEDETAPSCYTLTLHSRGRSAEFRREIGVPGPRRPEAGTGEEDDDDAGLQLKLFRRSVVQVSNQTVRNILSETKITPRSLMTDFPNSSRSLCKTRSCGSTSRSRSSDFDAAAAAGNCGEMEYAAQDSKPRKRKHKSQRYKHHHATIKKRKSVPANPHSRNGSKSRTTPPASQKEKPVNTFKSCEF